jgi:hypothetical protein
MTVGAELFKLSACTTHTGRVGLLGSTAAQ